MAGHEAGNTVRLPRLLADDIQEMDAQQQAGVTTPGNLVVIAGPGSGKTRTLVARAGYLLSTTISPLRGLAAIAFTQTKRHSNCGSACPALAFCNQSGYLRGPFIPSA